MKDKGSFTSVRGLQGKPQRGIQFTTTWVTAYDCRFDLLDTLRQQVEDGTLTLRVAGSVTIDNASEAHARLEAGGTRGRMVIKF